MYTRKLRGMPVSNSSHAGWSSASLIAIPLQTQPNFLALRRPAPICPPASHALPSPALSMTHQTPQRWELQSSGSKTETHPSWSCPTNRISGLAPPPTGALLSCFVRSNTHTSPRTVLVAMRSGFWGMYRARLISPSWRIVCLMRILAAVF